MIDTPIHRVRPVPSSAAGGAHIMMQMMAMGTAENTSQGRRRPIRDRVRSDRYPTSGSDTASSTREMPRMSDTAAGAISSTSVENFIR